MVRHKKFDNSHYYRVYKAVASIQHLLYQNLDFLKPNESFEIILERYNGELNESEKEFWITKKNDIYKELLKNQKKSKEKEWGER